VLLDREKIEWSEPDTASHHSKQVMRDTVLPVVRRTAIFFVCSAALLYLWMWAFGTPLETTPLLFVLAFPGALLLLLLAPAFIRFRARYSIDAEGFTAGHRKVKWRALEYYRIEEPTDDAPYSRFAFWQPPAYDSASTWLVEKVAGVKPERPGRWYAYPLPEDEGVRRKVVDEITQRATPMAEAPDEIYEQMEREWNGAGDDAVKIEVAVRDSRIIRTWREAVAWLLFAFTCSPAVIGVRWLGLLPDEFGWRLWLLFVIAFFTVFGPATWIAFSRFERHDLARDGLLGQIIAINAFTGLFVIGLSPITSMVLVKWFGLPG
jgi:MFS family permease